MLSCKEATRLCSEALDRALDVRERLSLRMHLMMCSGCANYRAQMTWLRQISSAYAAGAGAQPSAEDPAPVSPDPADRDSAADKP